MSKEKEVDISVIICTARAYGIELCLESLVRQTFSNFEVIIVDCIESSLGKIKKNKINKYGKKLKIKYIPIHEKNLSYSRNVGIKNAAGSIVSFIDDDAYAQKDWLNNIHSFFKKYEDADIVGGNVRSLLRDPVSIFSEKLIVFGEKIKLIDMVIGVNLSINMEKSRKNFRLRSLLFDECLNISGEDNEFCFYIQNLGGKVYFDPKIVVFHKFRKNIAALFRRHMDYGYGDALVMTIPAYKKYSCIGSYSWPIKRRPIIVYLIANFFYAILKNSNILTREIGKKWLPLILIKETGYAIGISRGLVKIIYEI